MTFLIDGFGQAKVTVLLADGARGPMESAVMTTARALAALGLIRVARFEFDYIASRRTAAG